MIKVGNFFCTVKFYNGHGRDSYVEVSVGDESLCCIGLNSNRHAATACKVAREFDRDWDIGADHIIEFLHKTLRT